jgi:hypothetical protein
MLMPRKGGTVAIGTLLAIALSASLAAQTADDRPARDQIREVATVKLATFHLANGNEVQILGVSEENDVIVAEITDAGPNERFVLKPGMNPAEVFRRLAPLEAPVPRMIAQADDRKALAGRNLVDSLAEPIEVPAERLGMAVSTIPQAAGAGSCQAGAAGADYFESHHCNTLGGPGYGSSESYCDKDARDWIDRSSGSRRRATYTRMASCGSGMNKMRHFYSTVSGWTTQTTVFVDPQKVISAWSYKKGVKRYRRVRFEENDTDGWVRGWMKYHSEVADGW